MPLPGKRGTGVPPVNHAQDARATISRDRTRGDQHMFRRYRGPALFLISVLLLITNSSVMAQSPYFSNWPAGTSPQEVGKRVAENFVARRFEWAQGKREFVIYPEVCAWYGSLTVAQLTKDKDLTTRLIQKFDPLMVEPDSKRISPAAHVDFRVFGVVPLELYMQTKERKYLDIGIGLADKQWENPTPDGITKEARYWIDDMFMITAVQVQAYRATGDAKYIDRAALTMAEYLDRLQQPNGLFYHAPDSKFYWGRGNGWVAVGMAELLRSLPKNHPRRARILAGYQEMMTSLLKYQGSDGLWRQLIDHPEAWAETSSTGMFTFAMITGVKNGWLERKTYGPAARRAWLGLVSHLNKDALVTDVCVGTNKANLEVGPDVDKQLKFYMDRPRQVGDLHGQSPILWSASALMR
jgi:rhamnogalacturonyl hydrolase YesR